MCTQSLGNEPQMWLGLYAAPASNWACSLATSHEREKKRRDKKKRRNLYIHTRCDKQHQRLWGMWGSVCLCVCVCVCVGVHVCVFKRWLLTVGVLGWELLIPLKCWLVHVWLHYSVPLRILCRFPVYLFFLQNTSEHNLPANKLLY